MKLKYRPDIDGLRGIAVISVILYHADFLIFGRELLTGGFLGVDIFFVISGYLITKQIILQIIDTNNFNFLNFSLRRARRLLPLFFIVFFLSIIIGYFILLPDQFKRFANSGLYQIALISNFHFWHYYNFSYMADSALKLPFLHTWSLSVEEQFYIISPIVILLILKYLKKYLFFFLIFGVVLSLAAAHYVSQIFSSFAFYMLPFRIWEFLIGSLVAYNEIFLNPKKNLLKYNFLKNFLVIISFLVIIFSIFYFDKKIAHPSFYTFPLVLAVGLIIQLNYKDNFIKTFLSNRFLVFFGLISYSLYLWHYPLFSFARIYYDFSFEKSNLIKILIIFISIIFSYISFNFIEKKFRYNFLDTKKFIIFLVISLTFLIFLSSTIIIKNGFPESLKLPNLYKETLAHSISNSQKTDEISTDIHRKKITVIGNSHGGDFKKILENNEYFSKNYFISHLSLQIECAKESILKIDDVCQRTFNKNKNFENEIRNFVNSDIIIIKSRMYNESLDSIEQLILFLKEFNKKIILVSSTPEFELTESYMNRKPIEFNKNIKQKIFYKHKLPIERFILEKYYFPNSFDLENINKENFVLLKSGLIEENIYLKKIAQKLGVDFLDFFSLLCNTQKQICISTTPNKKNFIYRDLEGHFYREGINFLSIEIAKKNWIR